MLTRLSIVASIAAGAALSLAASREENLIGQWKGETFAAGSTASMTLNLFPNGTYSKRIVSVTELGWTLEGDFVPVAPAIMGPNSEVSYGKAAGLKIKISGDSLVASSHGQSMVLKRVTWAVKDAPLLGRWVGQSDLNEGVTQDFTADGRLFVSVTLSREAGRYSVEQGQISWQEQIPNPSRHSSRIYRKQQRFRTLLKPITRVWLARRSRNCGPLPPGFGDRRRTRVLAMPNALA